MTRVNIIAARDRNGLVGLDKKLPWYLPTDLARFKELTDRNVVVMGRGTWASLPDRFRPLPGRYNVVISRDASCAPEAHVVLPSLRCALDALYEMTFKEVFVIGGPRLWNEALPYASRVFLTSVQHERQLEEGRDAVYWHAAFSPTRWRQAEQLRLRKQQERGDQHDMTLYTLERIGAPEPIGLVRT